MILAFFLSLMSCYTDYAIVKPGEPETIVITETVTETETIIVTEEVEVPVYIEDRFLYPTHVS